MGKINIDARGNDSIFEKISSFFSPSSETKSKFIFQLVNLSIENILDYEIFANYNVGLCRVYIGKDKKGKMHYLIDEPQIDNVGKAIYTKIMKFLYISLPSEIGNDLSTRIYLKKKIIEIAKKMKLEKHIIPILDTLLYYVMRDAFGYGIIDVLMKDDNLEDILEENFDSPVGIIHKKFGEYSILDTNISFGSIEATNSFVQKLVQRTGKSMTAAVPYIDSMTKEGHRIAATFGKEVSLPGPNFTIRKFGKKPLTITKLLQMGTLNPLMAAYVWTLLDSKAFVLIIGSTAAGKTTTIGALTSLINPQMKITTIEDTPELRMGHVHWQRLITRKGSSILSDKYEVAMNELVRLSLRSRPDYIVVGEVRGEEISSLIQAVATGHGGLTSFHASDASATLVRMKSPPMNVHLSGQMLISSIVQQNRLVTPDGKIVRRVTEITEIVPRDDKIELKKVMGWDASEMQFFPEGVEELVKNSERLREVSMINGWTKEDLTNQLITRMCFLMRMVQNNITEFSKVSEELEKFYYDPLERYVSVLATKSLGELSNEKISAKQLSNLGP
ncbi:type II/IV secretion system ATPase subunit [Nitrosopumilus ureiphilus]|uniref:Type II secretion system protein E n=1 Tax=Nitrosopumilus ureiphilus TaxID=1470067 RepID=A0A7D5M600_9ARCH|nr:type II/IV secretion system ATPase subunit [Nitrosopumilus ureiphilus]QLH07293.1 type II secretion system protein E [Nitrosopumilus ureiphilus]